MWLMNREGEAGESMPVFLAAYKGKGFLMLMCSGREVLMDKYFGKLSCLGLHRVGVDWFHLAC